MAPLSDALTDQGVQARRTRRAGPLLVAGIVGAASLALHVRDPHASGSWGYCPWKLLTGFDCPGCGTLRAVNDLTHGDLVAAASSNLLFVVAVPIVVALWIGWLRRSWIDAAPSAPGSRRVQVVWIAAFAATLVFTVVRNTPWGSWLQS